MEKIRINNILFIPKEGETKMLERLCDLVFRRSVLNDILIRAGQKEPSIFLQVRFGVLAALPYLFVCLLISIIALASYVEFRLDLCVYLGGGGISLVALVYGLCVSPLQGSLPGIQRFVVQSKKNNVRPQIIADNIPAVIVKIDRQVSVLYTIYFITSIVLFMVGVAFGGIGLLI